MFLPIGMNASLSDDEYNNLSTYVYEQTGIDLGSKKHHLLKARLMKRLRHYGFATFQEYYDFVTSPEGEHEIVELINRVSTNTTHFFREKKHFEHLSKIALPHILEKKRRCGDKRLRVWCSASSSGEEVYCLLMTILEILGEGHDFDFRILGTDISTDVLKIAARGEYDSEKVKPIPKSLLHKYFDKNKTESRTTFKIKDPYREYVVFRRLNLMRKTFPFRGKFDVIFCRNVMIYFNKETQAELVNKFYDYLYDGGYLYIGHSESLIGTQVKFKRSASSVFQKH